MATPLAPSGLARLRPQLEGALQLIHRWFKRMQHPKTHRMMYKYLPYKRKHIYEASPIRELGTSDTLLQLQKYTGSQEFDKTIQTTLDHYEQMLVYKVEVQEQGENFAEVKAEGSSAAWAFFSAEALREPSSIAHIAMMILALSRFTNYLPGEEKRKSMIEKLAKGIVKQQNPATGKFARIYFEPPEIKANSGWELYSGEAELALVSAYIVLRDSVLWETAFRAFEAYLQEFKQGSVRSSRSFVFYANWQCQAGRALLETCDENDVEKTNKVVDYMLQLQDEIVIAQKFFTQVAAVPEIASVVEVACALEGLVATYSCLLKMEKTREGQEYLKRREIYEKAIELGVDFLLLAQVKAGSAEEEAPPPEDAVGGFGYTLNESTQRVDVTGHVCDAFIRLLEVI